MKARIYHNPECSKSRATKALLETKGVELEVIEYLKTPPSGETLEVLVTKLGIAPRDLLRTGEADFKAAGLDLDAATDEQIVELIADYPRLLQRPIVEIAQAARIGRPPDAVLDLFE